MGIFEGIKTDVDWHAEMVLLGSSLNVSPSPVESWVMEAVMEHLWSKAEDFGFSLRIPHDSRLLW